MPLTPEERKQIYEEEKARIEAEEQQRRAGPAPRENPLGGLSPNIAALLCYAGAWVSGIIFLWLEEKNSFVRFHAAQSIVVFATLNILGISLGWIPEVGGILYGLVAAFAVVLWVVLMVKAYQGEYYKIPVAGDLAESLARATRRGAQSASPATLEALQPGAAAKAKDRLERHTRTRAGRIISSSFAIAWSIVLLVLFNFFHQYIAYYNEETVNNASVWTRYPLFTSDIHLWLPILTLTLLLIIIGHTLLIIFDRYVLRALTLIVLDIFALATVLTLLSVFPFDFSVIPNSAAADATGLAMRILLILIVAGIVAAILVRLIKLIGRLFGVGKDS